MMEQSTISKTDAGTTTSKMTKNEKRLKKYLTKLNKRTNESKKRINKKSL